MALKKIIFKRNYQKANKSLKFYETDGTLLKLWEKHLGEGNSAPLSGNTIDILFYHTLKNELRLPERPSIIF